MEEGNLMSKAILGIDIGSSSIKLSLNDKNKITYFEPISIPSDLINDRFPFSEEVINILKKALKSYKIKAKNCALVLPSSLVFTRKVTMPYMTIPLLMSNLPYEFRDYIGDDKNQYFYDYAVSKVNYNEENQPVSLDILAVATSKSTISKYRDFCSKVGLTLVTAIPDVFAYRNIYMNIKEAKPKEYGILDLGYTSSHVFIYNEDIYETSRVIEYGVRAIDVAIAESFTRAKDLASQKKLSDIYSVNALSDVERIYCEIAVAVMRSDTLYK